MKTKSAAASRHLERVAALGCLVCRNNGDGYTPAECHHTRLYGSAGKRSGHWLSIPLCSIHHRLGGIGVGFHSGRQTWEALNGDEALLLDQTLELLEAE